MASLLISLNKHASDVTLVIKRAAAATSYQLPSTCCHEVCFLRRLQCKIIVVNKLLISSSSIINFVYF